MKQILKRLARGFGVLIVYIIIISLLIAIVLHAIDEMLIGNYKPIIIFGSIITSIGLIAASWEMGGK